MFGKQLKFLSGINKFEVNVMIKKLYLFFNKASDFFQKPLEFIIALFLYTGVLAVIFQVLYRYVLVKLFHFSFPYTEEYSRYTIIWITYLGAGIVLKEGGLVSLNLLYDQLHGIPKYVIYFITRAMMFVFMYVVIRYGFDYFPQARMFKSPVIRISGVFLYMMPAAGCVLMFYETIVEMLGVMCGELKPFAGRPAREEKSS
jgi:TRAP-type C4-dicarboxylate transport system permease small subunit